MCGEDIITSVVSDADMVCACESSTLENCYLSIMSAATASVSFISQALISKERFKFRCANQIPMQKSIQLSLM